MPVALNVPDPAHNFNCEGMGIILCMGTTDQQDISCVVMDHNFCGCICFSQPHPSSPQCRITPDNWWRTTKKNTGKQGWEGDFAGCCTRWPGELMPSAQTGPFLAL